MEKIKGRKARLRYFCLVSILILQVLGGQAVYAAGSKMTNAMHKAYSSKLTSLGKGVKSAAYADLDQDEIYEMLVGRLDKYKGIFYLEVYKYSNNTIKLLDQIALTSFGSNSCGMNNFSVVTSKDGKSVALKQDFHHLSNGYATYETTHYTLKNGKLKTYLRMSEFSDAGAITSGTPTESLSYEINGAKATKANYLATAKKYVVENKMIDTGYSPKGGDSDECKDYTNRGNAIHKSVKEDIKLVINGEQIKNAVPIQQNGTTLVPIRIVSQYLGAEVSWKNPVITLSKNDKLIKLTVGSKTAIVNGQKVALDVAPIVIDGTTMVPLRFAAENLSAQADWDKSTLTVTITANPTATVEESKQQASTNVASNLTLLGQGKIDTLPYKMGTSISLVTKDLGQGTTDTYQGVRLHQYSNYTLNESLYSPILVGGFFGEGYTMYGFTIGKDDANTVRTQLGTPEVYSDLDGDEFATVNSTYCYVYSKNNYFLYVYFNAKGISERAVFVDKN